MRVKHEKNLIEFVMSQKGFEQYIRRRKLFDQFDELTKKERKKMKTNRLTVFCSFLIENCLKITKNKLKVFEIIRKAKRQTTTKNCCFFS